MHQLGSPLQRNKIQNTSKNKNQIKTNKNHALLIVCLHIATITKWHTCYAKVHEQ